jgi:hypothetical protein
VCVCVCLLILLMSDLVSKQSKDGLLLTTAALIVGLDVTVGQKCCTTRGIRCHLVHNLPFELIFSWNVSQIAPKSLSSVLLVVRRVPFGTHP